MSVTTVLVPVDEAEAEALLNGGTVADEALSGLQTRAVRLRRRIARVDSIREQLHELLFSRWAGAQAKPESPLAPLVRLFRKAPPPRVSNGYDPFVHIFGRSLPVVGATSKEVAERVTVVVAADETAFEAELAKDLRSLDSAAADLFRNAPRSAVDVDDPITAQATCIADALREPPQLVAALDAIVRLNAWSQPVWRLDGEMLPSLLRTLGIGVIAGSALPLFAELIEARADLAQASEKLPKGLNNFAGAGAFLTSVDVKMVAGALRMSRGRVAKNASEGDEGSEITLRHLRLLEEAIFFAEAQNFALAEAAGVEWHDRPRTLAG